MTKYEKLTRSIATIRTAEQQAMPMHRLVQFRIQEDYFNSSQPGSMPVLCLMFNGDISSPAKLDFLSCDARKIGRALIEAADRMEAKFAEASSVAFEEKHGPMGIFPADGEVYK